MRRMPVFVIAVLAAAGIAILVWAEYAHWRASYGWLGAGSGGDTEAIVVLGYRNRGRRANFVNRYRVRVGLRSRDPLARESILVLCGGAVGGEVPEAELMAQYARERGWTGEIRVDSTSTTTRENIAHAALLVAHAARIKVVSHSPHAEKAREYLWTLRPDLAVRLVRGEDYRWGEAPLLKVAAALIAARHRGPLTR